MRGPVGSEITLTIVRIGEIEPLEIVIERDVIKLTAAKVRSEGNVIIVRVTTFNEQTTPNIKDGIKKQIDNLSGMGNVDGFIIDLRNNGGGSLQEAIDLTGLFIETGPVVQIKSSSGRIEIEKDFDKQIHYEGPLLVLNNSFTASSSEIFSGALKDYNRGLIVGEPTFGKGTAVSYTHLTLPTNREV